VIAAAYAAVFDMAKFERRAAVRAAQGEQPDSALIVAKHDNILAEQSPA
jgi:hypothetical protein